MSYKEIREALRKVMDPELNQDIVSLGILKRIGLREKISIEIALTAAICPLKNKIKSDVIE